MSGRRTRRIIGALRAGLGKLGLGQVRDPRKHHQPGRELPRLLRAVLTGLCAGCKSLALLESLTQELSRAAARSLGLLGRVPDTTLRDLLIKLDPAQLRAVLVRQTKAAHRGKALAPWNLPFGVLAIDGKVTAIKAWNKGWAQRRCNRKSASGLLRTMTCSLVSSRADICIDAVPIPPETNEDGVFKRVVRGLLNAYASIDLFRLVVADAGSCSLSNASFLRDEHLHYLFTLNAKQPTLLAEAQRLLGVLGPGDALAITEDIAGGKRVLRTLWLTTEMAAYENWPHLRTTLRIQSKVFDADGNLNSCADRYFVSSLRSKAFSPDRWLELVRRYWATVEIGCHKTWDVSFEEDKRPWIVADDQGALCVALLRRIAHNIMALFRSVTQRSEERRAMPWADLLRWAYNALISATGQQLANLRKRRTRRPIPA